MTIEPFYISMGELFERKYVFRIPRYQRGYAWDEPEVEDFLKDLKRCFNARKQGSGKQHFFGSIISIKKEAGGSSGRHRVVIDGQQRIATFVLLACCTESQLRELARTAEAAGRQDLHLLAIRRAEDLRTTYRILDDEVNRVPTEISRLELSDPDRAYFAAIISENSIGKTVRNSHILLAEAYSAINQDLIDVLSKYDSLEEKIDCLAIVKEVMQRDAAIINIETEDEAEAYRIFQVVNNRGTKLSEGDLMRAATLEIVGKAGFEAEFEATAKCWDSVLHAKPTDSENFLRWHYASLVGERPGKSSLFEEFMDEVFPERNENSISKSKAKKVAKFTSLVASEYEYCERMLRGDWPWEKSTVAGWDSDRLRLLIESLEHTLCMPLLLAARACLAQKDFATIVHLTERFAFRCKLMCRVHTNSLQKVYHEHAARIRASPSSYKTVNLAIDFQKVVTAKASDELFSSSLGDQLVYQPNASNKYLKYFLSTLEHYQAWYSSGGQGQPKCKEKSRVFDLNQLTIEHIYPQSPFPAQSNSSLKPMVNLLGNLTLLGPEDNDKASNKSFEHKKVVFQGSSMQLNKEIAKNRSWNVVNLKKRTKVLCDLAIAVYKLQ